MVVSTRSNPKYWAFVSYSHADAAWGQWLQRCLENFVVPRRLRGRKTRSGIIPKRLRPVFRDKEELPTESDLGRVLRAALQDSQYLIVVCSPRAAQSQWVNEEVLEFKRSGRSDRILCLIVEGEPNATDRGAPELECFCPALRHEIDTQGNLSRKRIEPVAADVRPGRENRRIATIRLAAGLIGVRFDELRRRHRRRQQQRTAVASVCMVMLSVGTGGLWWWGEQRAAKEARAHAIAESRRLAAEAWSYHRGGEARQAICMLKRALPASLAEGTRPYSSAALDTARRVYFRTRYRRSFNIPDESLYPVGQVAGTGDLILYGTKKGLLVWPLNGSSPTRRLGGAFRFAVSLDGKAALAVERKGERATVYRLPDGLSTVLAPVGARIQRARFEQTGKIVAALLRNGHLAVWDAHTGALLWRSKQSGFSEVKLDPTGRRIAAERKESLVLLDASNGRQIGGSLGKDIRIFTFGPMGRSLVSADGNRVIEVWNPKNGNRLRRFAGHTAGIIALKVSPKGAHVASGSADGTVRIWDFTTGELAVLRRPGKSFYSLAFSPNGGEILLGGDKSNDPTLLLWQWQNGDATTEFRGRSSLRATGIFLSGVPLIATRHPDRGVRIWTTSPQRYRYRFAAPSKPLHSFVVDFREQLLATLDDDWTVRVFRIITGRHVRTIAPLKGHLRPSRGKHLVALAPYGSSVIIPAGKVLRRVPLRLGRRETALAVSAAGILAVAVSPDGRYIATSALDNVVRIWAADGGEAVLSVPTPHGPGDFLRFTGDGKHLVAGSTTYAYLTFIDVSARRVTASVRRPLLDQFDDSDAQAFAFDAASGLIAVLLFDGNSKVRLWNAATGRAHLPGMAFYDSDKMSYDSYEGIALAGTSRRLVAWTSSRIAEWSLIDGKLVQVTRLRRHRLGKLAVTADGKRWLLAPSRRGRAKILDRNGAQVMLQGVRSRLGHVRFVGNGRYAIGITKRSGVVFIWSTNKGRLIARLRGQPGAISRVLFSPDSGQLLTISGSSAVTTWRARDGRRIRSFYNGLPRPMTAGFSANGKRVGVVDARGRLHLFDAKTGKRQARMALRNWRFGHVRLLSFSPRGKRVLVAGRRGKLQIITLGGGVLSLAGHTGNITFAVFVDDGRRIVSAGEDKTLRLWDATSGRQLKVTQIRAEIQGGALAPGGRRVALALFDDTVEIRTTVGDLKARLVGGHRSWVRTVSFTPDGKRLVSGGNDGRAVLWDISRRKLLLSFDGDGKKVLAVDVSADGASAAVATQGGTVTVYPLISDDALLRWLHRASLGLCKENR